MFFFQYVGTWYTISSVPNAYIPVKKCMADTVTMQGEDMEIITRGFGEDGSRQSSEAILSEVVPFNPFEWPFLQLQASLVPPVPYHIVETDYTSYSCVYSCFDLLNIRAELFFILSRTPEISPEARQRCLDLFEENDIDTGKLAEMQQEGCPRDEDDDEEEVEEEEEGGEVLEDEIEDAGDAIDNGVLGDSLQNGDEVPEGSARRDSEIQKTNPVDSSASAEGSDTEDGQVLEDAVMPDDTKGCAEGAEGVPSADPEQRVPEVARDSSNLDTASTADAKKREGRYVTEEESGSSVFERAEDIVQDLEEDVASALEIVESSASKLIGETSEILEIETDVKRTDEHKRVQHTDDEEDNLGSSSPALSLPTAVSIFACLCLSLCR
ncbi:neurofilament medium polypeptide-like [Penaeus japonicus]|uniref:neurofilament medium polypeptide-like n=1 Tax=Penaeus japonicus TaxID=27405 RepID=UPI001C712889|nr:neurofilament medium polypeptide-like [Penaeus japonicus]